MAIKDRKCLSCATTYKYCPSCSRVDALKPAWASQFCSESCKDLWMTLTKFSMDRITKSEAASIISNLDLQPIDDYVLCVRRDYAKVMEEDKKPKRGKRAETKIIIDEAMDISSEEAINIVEELIENKIEQPIEVAETMVEETIIHEVVEKEN